MSENEMTPERPFNKAEVEDVFGILRSQDSILGIRLVDRLYATLQSALSRLEAAERELEQWRAEKQDAEHPKIRPMTRLEHAMMDMQRDLGSELSAQKTRIEALEKEVDASDRNYMALLDTFAQAQTVALSRLEEAEKKALDYPNILNQLIETRARLEEAHCERE